MPQIDQINFTLKIVCEQSGEILTVIASPLAIAAVTMQVRARLSRRLACPTFAHRALIFLQRRSRLRGAGGQGIVRNEWLLATWSARMPYAIGAELEIIPCGLDVPESRKDFLLERINTTIADSWSTTKPHWSREDSPFHDDFGLIFLHQDSEIVGYSLYKRLSINGKPVIYRAGAAIRNSYQGKGAYRAMTRAIFATEWEKMSGEDEIYYTWRTRHPVVYAANAQFCKVVAPSIPDGPRDAELQDVGVKLGKQIYPDCSMEVPLMIMRNSYDHMTYHSQPYHASDRELNAWFDRVIPNSLDAIFAVGRATRTTALGAE
jgi:hypothetical protein